jgi:broad specificity phosphatase PhoE
VARRANTGPAADTTIVLARHAETDWNHERRWQGHADPPLNARGREQALALAETLDGLPFDAVYASDLRRAHETALLVAGRHGLAVTPLRDLREVDVGSWTGLSQDEVKERFADAYAQVRARTGRGWEDGETYGEMGARVLAAVRRIARDHAGGTVLVVTHSGPVRALQARALGRDFATDRKAAPAIDRIAVAAVSVSPDGELVPADAALVEPVGCADRPG